MESKDQETGASGGGGQEPDPHAPRKEPESQSSSNAEESEAVKKRSREIKEQEDAAILRLQDQIAAEMSVKLPQGSASASATQAQNQEADSRSIFVGNVDHACTPEELLLHFQACGLVRRVTIATDTSGRPKGFAFIEFADVDSVRNGLHMNQSELHGRQLKVAQKRTNIPGMGQGAHMHRNLVPRYPSPYGRPSNAYGRTRSPRVWRHKWYRQS